MNCPSCSQENIDSATVCDSCGSQLIAPPNPGGEMPIDSTSVTKISDFVGRLRETSQLQVALQDAFGGQGAAVMLVGEPGIGKTRTAQELALWATELGAQVFWGACYEEEGTPPYWAWIQPIRAYVEQRYGIEISLEQGEQIKLAVGSAYPMEKPTFIRIEGHEQRTDDRPPASGATTLRK